MATITAHGDRTKGTERDSARPLSDLEAERIIQVDFGTGCVRDKGSAALWLYIGSGAMAAAVGGFIGVKLIRSRRKQGQKRGSSQGKRKK